MQENSQNNVLVLCANHRLAARWQARYANEAQAAGKTTWPSPSIYALSHWLLETWQKSSSTHCSVMDARLGLWHWREIIDQDGELPAYLQRHRTAELAQSAYASLCHWNISLDTLSDYPNPDTQRFYAWACHFQAEATRTGFITPEELPRAVAELIKTNRLKLPKRFMLLGFDSLSPSVEYLRSCLNTLAEEIPESRQPVQASIQRVECQDTLDEIRMMAHQTNAWLKQNPRARIACVVPNLSQIRHKIEQVFSEVCDHTFNISAGLCFAHLPMIHTALQILSCVDHPQLNTLNQIVLSPYLVASHADRALAALCLNELTKHADSEGLTLTSISDSLNLLGQKIKNQTLAQRWQALCKLSKPSKLSKAKLDQHAQHIEDILLAIGWPGQRNPNSVEYQVIERWHRLLLEMRLYAESLNPMPFKKALELLHMLALETVFQAKEADDTKTKEHPIQILGLLEASGAPCDHLWVMGLHGEAWPPCTNPHPLLPIDLQRRLNMPHASAEREYQLSRQIQQRLEETASTIIFSSPQFEQERHIQASTLIRHYPKIELDFSEINTPSLENPNVFELHHDFLAPKLKATETLRGGSRILQEQAECPFRAFARARLNAQPLEKPNVGLRKIDQGVMIHRVLELIWKELKTRTELCHKTEDALRQLIRQSIQKTIQHNFNHFILVEIERVEELVLKWLNFEKTRPEFRVREQETTRFWSLGPIMVQLKIDRIDELSDGSHLLIDYKTGETPSINDWYKPDMQYTQLPLYFLQNPHQAQTSEIQGIAYAKVNALKPELKSISHHDSRFDWATLKSQWQMRIDQLSHDFCEGRANPMPIHPSQCQRCELNSLCRREISV